MNKNDAEEEVISANDSPIDALRGWFAANLGVDAERKSEIYLDISKSATLQDTSYWLQILFSAGIAMLGMVLNSTAVVIGAMLISPLMGPILAGGLALAAGDVILGLRAITNIFLSCLLAVGFAAVLVSLLPFKEVTNEIASRTSPNTLDLGIALFSGAVGSIAICKEVKGVATSIPGVAIAVALMPPLCAIGFGLGIAVTGNLTKGLPIARGAGLLILTNLVAITFTAMLVFLALNIGKGGVSKKIKAWRLADDESRWAKFLISRFPGFDKLRRIGSLPGRFLLIFVPVAVISLPLYESFTQLQSQIVQKQKQNLVEEIAEEIWKSNFAELPNGKPRGYISNIETTVADDRTSVQINLLESRPLSKDDRERFEQMIITRLGETTENLNLQLVEIPMTSSDLLAKTQTRTRNEIRSEAEKVFSEKQAALAAQMRENSLTGITEYLRNLDLPAPAELVSYEIKINEDGIPNVKLIYLSSREIGGNEQVSIADEIHLRLDDPAAKVSLAKIEPLAGTINFNDYETKLPDAVTAQLDSIARTLQQYPNLSLVIGAGKSENESGEISNRKAELISDYLASRWKIAAGRITVISVNDLEKQASLNFKVIKDVQ